MGWLDRLTGKKIPTELDIPPGFDPLIGRACNYILICFASGFVQARSEANDRIVKEQTAAGVDPTAAAAAAERMFEADPSYSQGDPMGCVAVVIQFAHQLASYVERPSGDITHLASFLFVTKCLSMPNLSQSGDLALTIARHDDAVKMLLNHCRIRAEAPATLKSEWNRLAIGIVLGNRMAQDSSRNSMRIVNRHPATKSVSYIADILHCAVAQCVATTSIPCRRPASYPTFTGG